jgi:hypothetical protein
MEWHFILHRNRERDRERLIKYMLSYHEHELVKKDTLIEMEKGTLHVATVKSAMKKKTFEIIAVLHYNLTHVVAFSAAKFSSDNFILFFLLNIQLSI